MAPSLSGYFLNTHGPRLDCDLNIEGANRCRSALPALLMGTPFSEIHPSPLLTGTSALSGCQRYHSIIVRNWICPKGQGGVRGVRRKSEREEIVRIDFWSGCTSVIARPERWKMVA